MYCRRRFTMSSSILDQILRTYCQWLAVKLSASRSSIYVVHPGKFREWISDTGRRDGSILPDVPVLSPGFGKGLTME